jgi:hypothetical protein
MNFSGNRFESIFEFIEKFFLMMNQVLALAKKQIQNEKS